MRKSRLTKHLDHLEVEDLREEIIRLYDSFKDVRNYYAMELGTESERAKKYEQAKEKIASKFISRSRRRVRRPRVAQARKIMLELERHTVFPHEMIDVHLYACETALAFGERYQYSSTPLYNFISDQFSKAKDLVQESRLESEFEKRIEKIRHNLPKDLNL